MVKSVIINADNVINDIYKNRFRYNFPAGQYHLKDSQVAVSRLQMYNSIYNVSTQIGNNTFSIIWNADSAVQYDITIPDGQYTIPQMNLFIQYVCIQNNLFLITDTSDYAYYIELLPNPTKNLVELICYALPTALPSGWSLPSGATWTLPLAASTPQLVIPEDFGYYLGFDAGTYPPAVESTDYNVLAQDVDRVNIVESLIVNCNLVYNSLSVPATQVYSFSLSDIAFGALLNASPSAQFNYINIVDGIYAYIDVWFTDERGNPVYIRDTDIVIMLSIKQHNEM
jgi:hypothetical protein